MAFLSLTNFVCAQSIRKNDVIVRRDSSRIQALILQVSYEKVNYRDLAAPDSAKAFIYMDQVARILLKSGKTIHVKDSTAAVRMPPDTAGQYADMTNLPENPFDRSVVMANSDQLRNKYEYYKNKSIDGKTGTIVFTSFAAASLVSGIIIANSGNSPDNKKFGNSLAVAGPVFGGVFGLVCFKNYKLHKKKAEKVKTELERRNQPLESLRLVPGFDILNKSGFLTLSFFF
ncbi:hypothetical protein FEM33_11400 [Dyadobacter flavalbus]|uniref:Uncharacterized protein n=1 Tax=Dyadobacter flavalbus TaxID=2579942 RepID=A0A5M8QTP6_9BACT|nr:hypothetical protein FEM33_11400 [Dyadobacter flavalbus]